jgi:hypothetical protein
MSNLKIIENQIFELEQRLEINDYEDDNEKQSIITDISNLYYEIEESEQKLD